MANQKPKIPILYYEEPVPGEPANPIPYIEVGLDDDMPKVLFISEYKETGEYEVDTGHGSMPIVDMTIHKYVDLDHLQKLLSPERFDEIRVALGMKPLKTAQQQGQQILDKVYENAEKRRQELENSQEERQARAFSLGEKLKHQSEEFLKKHNNNEEKN